MWEESEPRTPMVGLLSMGSDPTASIEALAKKHKIGRLHGGVGGLEGVLLISEQLWSNIHPGYFKTYTQETLNPQTHHEETYLD